MTTGARRFSGLTLGLVGLAVLAHPLYLERFLIYPGVEWSFVPLVHAALSAVGALLVAGGIVVARGRAVRLRGWVGLAVAVVAVVPLYGVLLAATGPLDPSFPGSGIRRAFVAGLFAGAFLVGGGLAGGRPRRAAAGIAVPVVLLVPVVVEWTQGALLEPVLELYFLLTGAPISGIPYLGSLLLVSAALLGLGVELASEGVDAEAHPPTEGLKKDDIL